MNCSSCVVWFMYIGECGGRSDVRWMSLEDFGGPGLAIAAADGPLHVNVSRYGPTLYSPDKAEYCSGRTGIPMTMFVLK